MANKSLARSARNSVALLQEFGQTFEGGGSQDVRVEIKSGPNFFGGVPGTPGQRVAPKGRIPAPVVLIALVFLLAS